jgi:hypothetical protein
MKAVKTFEEACLALGYDASIPTFENAPEKHRKALLAHYKLIIIVEAINDGWTPNWNNTDEYKYELFPDIVKDEAKPSGFWLAYHVYDLWLTNTHVSSRLCFVSREAAKHCFETFKELYEDYLLIG